MDQTVKIWIKEKNCQTLFAVYLILHTSSNLLPNIVIFSLSESCKVSCKIPMAESPLVINIR